MGVEKEKEKIQVHDLRRIMNHDVIVIVLVVQVVVIGANTNSIGDRYGRVRVGGLRGPGHGGVPYGRVCRCY